VQTLEGLYNNVSAPANLPWGVSHGLEEPVAAREDERFRSASHPLAPEADRQLQGRGQAGLSRFAPESNPFRPLPQQQPGESGATTLPFPPEEEGGGPQIWVFLLLDGLLFLVS